MNADERRCGGGEEQRGKIEITFLGIALTHANCPTPPVSHLRFIYAHLRLNCIVPAELAKDDIFGGALRADYSVPDVELMLLAPFTDSGREWPRAEESRARSSRERFRF